MSRELLTAIEHLSTRQAGHVANWQLMLLGLSKDAASRMATRHGWTRVHRGVSRLMSQEESLPGAAWAGILASVPGSQRGALLPECSLVAMNERREAALTLGRTTVPVTGLTAAALHNIVQNAPTRPQLLVPHTGRRDLPGVQAIRTRLPLPEFDLVQGVPTVPALRMLWDTAWIIRYESEAPGRMMRWMSAADGLRLVRAEDLHHVARHPGAYNLPSDAPRIFRMAAFALAKGHSHSDAERRGREIVREVAHEMGFVVEPRPLAVPDEENPVAELDVALPLLMLDFEIDGPHHDLPAQQRKDRWRDDQVVRLGWTVCRYRCAWVTDDPVRFRRMVSADIRRAAAVAGITVSI